MNHQQFQNLVILDEVRLPDGREGVVSGFKLRNFPFTEGMRKNATVEVQIAIREPHEGERIWVRFQDCETLTLI